MSEIGGGVRWGIIKIFHLAYVFGAGHNTPSHGAGLE